MKEIKIKLTRNGMRLAGRKLRQETIMTKSNYSRYEQILCGYVISLCKVLRLGGVIKSDNDFWYLVCDDIRNYRKYDNACKAMDRISSKFYEMI